MHFIIIVITVTLIVMLALAALLLLLLALLLGKLGEQAEAGQRRVSRAVREAGEQRGIRVDPATQHVGSIAEHDPGVYAFGRA